MKIEAIVKTRKNKSHIQMISKGVFEVWVKSIPEKGRANKEIRDILADYFDVSKKSVTIIRGHKSRIKLWEILE